MFSRNEKRLIRAASVGLVLLSVSGCVRESANESEHVFQYELWVSGGVLLLGIVAAAGGFFLRKHNTRAGWALLILGPLGTLAFAPSMFLERTVVRKDGFEMSTGIWGQTVVPPMKFAELSGIRMTSETRRTRRGGKSTSFYLNCDNKNGGSTKVPVNNGVAQAAAKLILQEAMQQGIPFRDETGQGR
jgi:hypothetical protein